MVDFAGWEMPQQYTSVKQEQEAVRTGAGLFDVSHMGRFEIRGDQATSFLDRVVTNDVARLAAYRAQYNLICKEDGGVLDDLVVYRGEDAWTVVVNASNREKDLTWLRQYLPDGVEIEDVSEQVSLLALQGPSAQSILPAEGVDLDAIPYFGLGAGRVAGAEVMISRARLPAAWRPETYAGWRRVCACMGTIWTRASIPMRRDLVGRSV
jgi:aminomethyltransferase